MQPASTLLFFVGYLLALPIALRMSAVVANQHRIAFTGHQVGVFLAMAGWLTRGAFVIALIHVAWMIGVRLWFSARWFSARRLSARRLSANARRNRS